MVRLVTISAVMALAACTSGPTRVPLGQPQLDIDNGTTLTVTVEINGQHVGDYGPGTQTALDLGPLPQLPWHLVARWPNGRTLLTFDVPAGDPDMTAQPQGESDHGGHGSRVYLTCGTLLIWAGTVPMPQSPFSPTPTDDCSP